MVQYSLSVPKPHRLTLNNLLFQKLNEILDNLEKEGNQIFFDKNKWSSAVNIVFNKHILTIRDINSIINILSFEYSIVVEDVNFTDFFLLTLLRIKNSNLYEYIYENEDKFFLDLILDKEKEITKNNFQNLLNENKKFKEILELLFPTLVQTTFSEYNFGSKEVIYNDHKNKYLVDKYYFENYFSLSIPEDKLAYKDFKEIENTILNTDFDNFKDKISQLDKERKSFLFLEMFEHNSLEKLNEQKKLENAFYNLINISYKFKKDFSSTYVNPLIKYENIAFKILKKIEEIEEFVKIFFFEKDEIPLIIKIDIFQDIKEENSFNKLKISDEIKEKIFNYLKNKLKEFSLDDLFKEIYNKLSLFGQFKYFNISIDKISKEINEYMFKSDNNFFKLLKEFKYCKISSDGNKVRIAKDVLKMLCNLNSVQKYIDDLNEEIKNKNKELLEIWDES
ncbi:hypothetical protein ACN2EN_07585 [Aliarcobacter lanthieri]|uniref:hypothetical protein n=1 Tax=Aliarcobacter lanthieri TaxID=1355374 RepID=UPI003AFB7C75